MLVIYQEKLLLNYGELDVRTTFKNLFLLKASGHKSKCLTFLMPSETVIIRQQVKVPCFLNHGLENMVFRVEHSVVSWRCLL